MRIAMLGWEFPPFKSGGLGVHCYELTRALASRGVEVDFYMPRTEFEIKGTTPRLIQVMPVYFGPYTAREAYGWDFMNRVMQYNLRCAEEVEKNHKERNYDLIHNHDWLTMRAGVLAKQKIKKPHVCTVHSTEYDRSSLGPNNHILEIERMGMHAADRVITVSNMMKRQIVEKFGVDCGKIRVVYNGVDPDKFKKKWEVRKYSKEKVVLFLGRMAEQKGPVQFLQAAKKVLSAMSNVRFVMAGGGDMLPYLINYSIELGISDKVTFLGYIPEDQLHEAYAKSDVYVLPSISEPFGITALEAMASGTPIILSKTSGVSEITTHCLRVDFWDVNKMAEYIIALLKYRVLNHTMGRYEVEDARRFSWGKTADETLKVYRELV
ncbi:MAG: glycosyltransferase family 4 protein [Candidatus Micrarchaeia archaeon]